MFFYLWSLYDWLLQASESMSAVTVAGLNGHVIPAVTGAGFGKYVIPAVTGAGFGKYVIPALDRAVAWDLYFLKPSFRYLLI